MPDDELDEFLDEFKNNAPKRPRKRLLPQCEALTVYSARCQYGARYVRDGRAVCKYHVWRELPVKFFVE